MHMLFSCHSNYSKGYEQGQYMLNLMLYSSSAVETYLENLKLIDGTKFYGFYLASCLNIISVSSTYVPDRVTPLLNNRIVV